MLVYGNHSEICDPTERLARIDEEVASLCTLGPGIERHSRLVGALVEAGGLLQGVADADFAALGQDRRTHETDRLGSYVQVLADAVRHSCNEGFSEVATLPSVDHLPQQVKVRSPEGFAFYAVYPEAFIEAARRLRLNGRPRVIGIRSIGTTLGAVVATALGARPPITVRPFGAAFARQISIAPELERELLEDDTHYVIVDEGPGLSGSSFGAVADWLRKRGVPHDRIAFVPSHAGEPGPQASEAHRRLWNGTQRSPADFGGLLLDHIAAWMGVPVSALADISGGQWRTHVYADEREWPAVSRLWERRKFLATVRDEQLLVKFAGLGAIGERKFGMARALHSAGFVPQPLRLVHGFIVERWCSDARRLAPSEIPVGEIAAYLGARARLFPADADAGASLAKLFEMSRRNISLAFGKEADALNAWEPHLDSLSRRINRVCTDNKLDRHEWMRAVDGRLLKADALDHHTAHDLIGSQDLAWDVAGAIAEFAMDQEQAHCLVRATEHASGRAIDPELLLFHRIAYAAFRLGQATLAADPNAVEATRLKQRAAEYADQLCCLLHQRARRENPAEILG